LLGVGTLRRTNTVYTITEMASLAQRKDAKQKNVDVSAKLALFT